jgi:hypothetical protein
VQPPGTSDVDVVIVGAGAAGLAAARTAGELSLSFVVLEAMDRIGDRAHTDTSIFGVPWDRDCHWLHSADVNPMRELADQYGFHYLSPRPPYQAHFLTGFANAADIAEGNAYLDQMTERIEQAGRDGNDVSATGYVDANHPSIPSSERGLRPSGASPSRRHRPSTIEPTGTPITTGRSARGTGRWSPTTPPVSPSSSPIQSNGSNGADRGSSSQPIPGRFRAEP